MTAKQFMEVRVGTVLILFRTIIGRVTQREMVERVTIYPGEPGVLHPVYSDWKKREQPDRVLVLTLQTLDGVMYISASDLLKVMSLRYATKEEAESFLWGDRYRNTQMQMRI